VRTWLTLLTAIATLTRAASSAAAEEPTERQLTPDEINTWLERPSGAETADSSAETFLEAPPPPPRSQGLVVESGLGGLGHLGALAHVTPLSPWFHLKAGYEPLRCLLTFAETDLVFSNTSYARSPPPPRTYRLYGFGAGLRFSLPFGDRFGAYLEGSAGLAAVTGDVLEIYGYRQANELNAYFGGRLGAEWYPLNPHLALGVHVGMRSYNQGLRRQRSSETALAVLSGAALRYTF
jgi:hypothetical protein